MAAETRKRRALVVEDERPIRELVRLHLELGGFAVDQAADGTHALALVRATAFDLLILDVMLPGLDGVTLCSAIRAAGPNRQTPILMLTARDATTTLAASTATSWQPAPRWIAAAFYDLRRDSA
jgi:DNA-binding response OmpR family regulator